MTLAAGLLSWVFVADPIVDDSSRTAAARAVAVAYPVGDVLLLAMLVALLAVPGVRSATFRLLAASIVLMLVADTVFAASGRRRGTPTCSTCCGWARTSCGAWRRCTRR